MMSRPPSSVDLADDGGDLRRARRRDRPDIVPCVPRLPAQKALCQRPGSLHRRALGTASRLHVARARRSEGPRSRCPGHALAQRSASSRYDCSRSTKLLLAEMQQRRSSVEQDHRVVRVGHVDLRHALAERLALLDRVDHARRQRGPRAVGSRRRRFRRPRRARSRDRLAGQSPSMIGRSNSAYCGPNSSISVPSRRHEVQLASQAAEPDRPPLGHERLRRSTGSTRRSATSATHGDSSSSARDRARFARQDVCALADRRRAPGPRRSTAGRCRGRRSG